MIFQILLEYLPCFGDAEKSTFPQRPLSHLSYIELVYHYLIQIIDIDGDVKGSVISVT